MLRQEHVKQASTEKVMRFTAEVFAEVMNLINEQTGYLNDTEKTMCAVLLSDMMFSACEEIINKEGINLIRENLTSAKEKNKNEGTKNNQKKW